MHASLMVFEKESCSVEGERGQEAGSNGDRKCMGGVSNGHRNFQLLAKFGLCSICSQDLDECSLARVRKIFEIARMFGFSLKFARFLKIL